MAEGAAPRHGFVASKRVEWVSEVRDMENISNKNDFAIETEFGRSSTKEGELSVVAESDISAVTLLVREERLIII